VSVGGTGVSVGVGVDVGGTGVSVGVAVSVGGTKVAVAVDVLVGGDGEGVSKEESSDARLAPAVTAAAALNTRTSTKKAAKNTSFRRPRMLQPPRALFLYSGRNFPLTTPRMRTCSLTRIGACP
jgi:hypothetical protein